jgi:hypothetical protein
MCRLVDLYCFYFPNCGCRSWLAKECFQLRSYFLLMTDLNLLINLFKFRNAFIVSDWLKQAGSVIFVFRSQINFRYKHKFRFRSETECFVPETKYFVLICLYEWRRYNTRKYFKSQSERSFVVIFPVVGLRQSVVLK